MFIIHLEFRSDLSEFLNSRRLFINCDPNTSFRFVLSITDYRWIFFFC